LESPFVHLTVYYTELFCITGGYTEYYFTLKVDITIEKLIYYSIS